LGLFRRVAKLRSAIEVPTEEMKPLDDGADGTDDASDQDDDQEEDEEDGESYQSFWDRGLAIGRNGGPKRKAHSPAPVEERRAPEAISFDRAVAAYNALASHFSQADFEAFEQRWHPEAVAHAEENRLAEDPQGDFWLIRSEDTSDPHGLVVPGPEIVRKWELYYRSMSSMAAKSLLQGLYDIKDDAPLRVDRPAIATKTEQGWRVSAQGTFAAN
jgi:hypothetical protein